MRNNVYKLEITSGISRIRWLFNECVLSLSFEKKGVFYFKFEAAFVADCTWDNFKMPVFHTKTIESILEPVAQQVGRIICPLCLHLGVNCQHFYGLSSFCVVFIEISRWRLLLNNTDEQEQTPIAVIKYKKCRTLQLQYKLVFWKLQVL